MPGTLFLVATPIGNLGDMTPRALQVLTDADLIAAEDTRRTLQLLNHFSIKGKLIHYDENNKEKQGPVLLQELLQGNNVALVQCLPHRPGSFGTSVHAFLFRSVSAKKQKEPERAAGKMEADSRDRCVI